MEELKIETVNKNVLNNFNGKHRYSHVFNIVKGFANKSKISLLYNKEKPNSHEQLGRDNLAKKNCRLIPDRPL